MSRYSFDVVRDGTRYLVSFGYDYPCTEYFLHVEYADAHHCRESEEDGNPELLFAIASYNTLKCHPDHPGKFRWSNGEMLEMYQCWDVPSVAQTAVALDQPF